MGQIYCNVLTEHRDSNRDWLDLPERYFHQCQAADNCQLTAELEVNREPRLVRYHDLWDTYQLRSATYSIRSDRQLKNLQGGL